MEGIGVERMDAEAGGHRTQRIPPTERSGRVHSSTVTVAVLDGVSHISVPEKSFSDFSFQDETLVEVMDRLQPEVNEGESEAVIHAIDLDKARQLFQQKVAEQGWPEHIQRNRTRRGRPLKAAA